MRPRDLQLALQDGEEGELHGDTEQGGDLGHGEEEEAKGLISIVISVFWSEQIMFLKNSDIGYFLDSTGTLNAVIFPSEACVVGES